MNLDINFKNINSVEGLPFFDNYFDAIYSHMFYNMGFTAYELEPLFKETSPFLRIMVYYHFLLEMTKILC